MKWAIYNCETCEPKGNEYIGTVPKTLLVRESVDAGLAIMNMGLNERGLVYYQLSETPVVGQENKVRQVPVEKGRCVNFPTTRILIKEGRALDSNEGNDLLTNYATDLKAYNSQVEQIKKAISQKEKELKQDYNSRLESLKKEENREIESLAKPSLEDLL